jgi:hypothetical protein
MVPPSSPTVPSDENHTIRPETAFDHGVYLVNCPLRALSHVSVPARVGVGRVFIKLAGRVDPGDIRQSSCGRVQCELAGRELAIGADSGYVLEEA